ncbi:MAG: ATP-dependent Clp protease ATP-binding subunit ClpA [Nitrospirae bacterium]|nr:ATP-dependent Clp protease ATP-binding subunit ClpA [Nitrospirota bacterium]
MINRDLEISIEATINEAKRRGHEYLCIEHILFAILHDEKGIDIVTKCGGVVSNLKADLNDFFGKNVPKLPKNARNIPQPTIGFQRVLQRALWHLQSSGKEEVDAGDLLASIYMEEDCYAAYYLQKEGITRLDVLNYISHGITKLSDDDSQEQTSEEPYTSDTTKQPDPLKQFTVNLIEKAASGDIDPLVGREREIERTIQILCRRRKNNPVFVGEPGVGKTAIVEGLALKICEGNVPDALKNTHIFLLDMGGMLAGTKFRGEFEARLKATIDSLKKIKNAILFIDEIHTVVGAGATSGGSLDASNILKPVLNSGKLRCIGASTYEEYKNYFEKDRALSRRFQKIEVQEPSIEESCQILSGLKPYYEEFHGVHFTTAAIKNAVELSAKYINDRYLPDKAIDVMDEAGALVKLLVGSKRTVGVLDVEKVVAKMAKIPARTLSVSEADRLQSLETELKRRVFGQDVAIASVVTAIKRSRSGLGLPDRPTGCFLFTGPTGVGKTEIAKQLSNILGVKFIRFDMSEYMEKHAVARLIGAPPGYVGFDQGGMLTDEIRKNPFSVVLFDEIEKAHQDVYNILLQVMDYATLTDNNGKKADFRNVIVIMTSNAGAREMDRNAIGFGDRTLDTASKGKDAVKQVFSPEFRNRLDDIVFFNPLADETMAKIVDKFVEELALQLKQKKVSLTVSQDARQWLRSKGFDAHFGARPLSRLLQKELKTPLADEILFGRLKAGGNVCVNVVDDKIEFEYNNASI